MISFFNEDIEAPELNEELIQKWIFRVLENHHKKLGTLNIIFCSDTYILKVNIDYLQHDYFTDIITFDYCSNTTVSGDLFISLDTVLSNSKQFANSYYNELNRVIIHGVLHLLGFKDKSDEESALMRLKEDESLSLLATFL